MIALLITAVLAVPYPAAPATGSLARAHVAPAWTVVVPAKGTALVPKLSCSVGDYQAMRLDGRYYQQLGSEFYGAGPIGRVRPAVATFTGRAWFNFRSRAIRVAVWCES
jgi:hypothetical protein